METPVRLQPMTRARLSRLGDAGAAWTAALPDLLDRLADRWGLVWGRGLPGGSASYVVAARRGEEDLVVKVPTPDLPEDVRTGEARVLAAAAGRGYAVLHASDEASGALLMERLGTSLDRSGRSPLEQARVLAGVLAQAWAVKAPGAAAVDKGASLATLVRRLDAAHPGAADPGAVRLALELAGRRSAARGEVPRVLCHGDPHPSNTLRVRSDRSGAPSGWVLVDPDGFLEDPAYDLGVVLRDFSSHLHGPDAADLLRGWCAEVAGPAGVDADRVWEWAFLERVSTGLYVTSFGAPAVGRPLLETAANLARLLG